MTKRNNKGRITATSISINPLSRERANWSRIPSMFTHVLFTHSCREARFDGHVVIL